MNPEALFTPMKGGKKELSPADMSAISGWPDSHVKKAMDVGYLNPPHYTSKYAVDGVQLDAADVPRVAEHERVLRDKTKGKHTDEAIHEAAVGLMVEEKKKEGRPILYKYKERSAEEVFSLFLKSPAGNRRLGKNGIANGEIDNISRGGKWFDIPANQHPMPENFDSVLWETTKVKAAEFYLAAQLGDKEAEGKYNRIRGGLSDPTLLPALGSGKKQANV